MSQPFRVSVVTPDGPVLLKKRVGEEEKSVPILKYDAKSVVIPLHDGLMGVENLHTPTIGKLGYGVLEIRLPEGKGQESLYIDGGVVQIKDNHVSVLASFARTAQQLDKAELQKQLETLGSPKSLEDQVQKDKLNHQIQLFA